MTGQTANAMLVAMLRAIEAQDLGALGDLLAEDAVFDGPFGLQGPTLARGRQAVLDLMAGVFENLFEHAEFFIEREYPCTDANVGIAEYRSQVRLRSGKPYANRYITVCEVKDGRIALFREYFNPLALTPAKA